MYVEWRYPPSTQSLTPTGYSQTRLAADWPPGRHGLCRVPRPYRPKISLCVPSARREGLRLSPSTITSVLVSNVYTYTEPSLAMHPSTDHALLLWVHDDIARPVGQAQEINFSRWDGSAWSAPAGLTNDDLLDGAPRSPGSNRKGLAVWHRLNDTLPITATWDITTAQRMEIATASFDLNPNIWSPVILLTDNSALDMTPQFVRNAGGGVLAAWRQNDAGLVNGTAALPTAS